MIWSSNQCVASFSSSSCLGRLRLTSGIHVAFSSFFATIASSSPLDHADIAPTAVPNPNDATRLSADHTQAKLLQLHTDDVRFQSSARRNQVDGPMTALFQGTHEAVNLLQHQLAQVVHLAQVEELAHQPTTFRMLIGVTAREKTSRKRQNQPMASDRRLSRCHAGLT